MSVISRRLLAEPLTHFALIGLALFLLDWATSEPPADPKLIRVDAEVHRELADIFADTNQRLPTPAEMDRLVQRFLVTETLYREARALQLDHGDRMMRDRLISRMQTMLYSGVTVSDPDDETLRAWVDERANRYGRPEKVSFQLIGLDGDEAAAQRLADDANARAAAGDAPNPGGADLVLMNDRPLKGIRQLFGDRVTDAILAAEPGVWTPLDTPRGWQVVRFDGLAPPVAPDFERVAARARADWKADRAKRDAYDALNALMDTYTVERDPYGADVVELDEERSSDAEPGADLSSAPADAVETGSRTQ